MAVIPSPQSVAQSFNCNRCNVSFAHFQSIPNARLRILFQKSSMTSDVISKIFRDGRFEMPEAFDVPASVLIPIGMKSYRIRSGHYNIIENHEYIIIDF
jgi:hypothetical protein